jgi:O-antigen/teichoic acid export membrane protein
MKPISASVFVGVLLAFVVIYILRPLGPGAVALVVIVCVGLCATIGGVVAALFKKKK